MKQVKKILLNSLLLFLLTACVGQRELKLSIPTADKFKMEYLNAINSVRSMNQICGTKGYFPATKALKWNDKLYNSAYEHSYDLATSNTFSHTGSGQVSDNVGLFYGSMSSAKDRINAYGYEWRIYAENIGAGTNIDTAEKLVSKLLASDGHCANMMNPSLTEVGMAMVKNTDAKYTYYWTQDFGSPLSR